MQVQAIKLGRSGRLVLLELQLARLLSDLDVQQLLFAKSVQEKGLAKQASV